MHSMDETTTAAIRSGFRDYFENATLELPNPIPARGTVEGGGWHVCFVRHESPHAVDFFAQNRMTNTRHVRIAADGSAESLENYQDGIITQPGDDNDWAKASQRQAEHNQRVTEILREKGLID